MVDRESQFIFNMELLELIQMYILWLFTAEMIVKLSSFGEGRHMRFDEALRF